MGFAAAPMQPKKLPWPGILDFARVVSPHAALATKQLSWLAGLLNAEESSLDHKRPLQKAQRPLSLTSLSVHLSLLLYVLQPQSNLRPSRSINSLPISRFQST
jgi:hypothetical protein